jgi:hypothetical protein
MFEISRQNRSGGAIIPLCWLVQCDLASSDGKSDGPGKERSNVGFEPIKAGKEPGIGSRICFEDALQRLVSGNGGPVATLHVQVGQTEVHQAGAAAASIANGVTR